ncbi:hypothetical protein ABZ719_30625 [Streptomyces sp. NPDC006743]|uniref:hypothetical protein n=1 Tax=Streptomyces sp. NPDC006743 TaxID=3154480 RepID=UPI0034543275
MVLTVPAVVMITVIAVVSVTTVAVAIGREEILEDRHTVASCSASGLVLAHWIRPGRQEGWLCAEKFRRPGRR